MNEIRIQPIVVRVLKYLITFPEVVIATAFVVFPHWIVTMLNGATDIVCQLNEICRVLAPAIVILVFSVASFWVRRIVSAHAVVKIGGFHFFVIGVAIVVLVKYLSNPIVFDPYWIANISMLDRLIEVSGCVGLGYVIGDVLYFCYFKFVRGS